MAPVEYNNFPTILWSRFDYFNPILQLLFSPSESGYHYHRLDGPRSMENLVLVLIYCVEMNGVIHIHMLAWIVGPCLFHSPNEVIFQYTVLPTSLW